MKTHQVTLPAMQLAAAMYFAQTASAEEHSHLHARCVDATGTEVAAELCGSNSQKRDVHFFAASGSGQGAGGLARRGDGPEGSFETGGFAKRAPQATTGPGTGTDKTSGGGGAAFRPGSSIS